MMKECDITGLAGGLVDWYWNAGRRRSGGYELSLSGWVNQLYSTASEAAAVEDALRNRRPAMAIWGPSQTGKSTLISAYIDGEADICADEAQAGLGTGLHWPGGEGFYFMAPMVEKPEDLPHFLTRKVLNPYNKGMDGSSCLSRFMPGTIDGAEGTFKVVHPAHPAQMKMVTPRDLWHALARGYSTECYGPERGDTTKWNLDLLRKKLRQYVQQKPAPRGSTPDRAAYEALHDFCGVICELAESDDPTFRGLGADMKELSALLDGMLEEPALLHSRDAVLAFAAQILWDGFDKISGMYRAMTDTYLTLVGKGGQWEGKRVFCSLKATALFLNMGACEISYKPMPDNPLAPEAILKTMISRLGWREKEGDIIIDCVEGMPHSLAQTPEQFCIIQGLVWELVIPINLANLKDRPFSAAPQRPNALKEYLKVADILDFPGVGNEKKSMVQKIILDDALAGSIRVRAASPDATSEDRERVKFCFTAQVFFKEVLKRGKTASIVSTYARRLNMDAFSVFQGIRTTSCPNADQIINGVRAWWRHAMPEYFQNQRGPSPMPLNLALTWWAGKLNMAKNVNDSNIYGVIEEVVASLGPVRAPGTCTTFAIHNHKSPDRDNAVIKEDFSPGSPRYNNLMKESAFARQFANPVSRRSFDEMVQDLDTGGAEYFFTQVRQQILDLRSGGGVDRIARLEARRGEICAQMLTLFRQNEIFPNPKPRDTRREKLEAFLSDLESRVAATPASRMQALNLALRNLLNVDFEALEQVPMDRRRIGVEFVQQQYQRWINAQAARCAQDGLPVRRQDPDWRLLGMDGPDRMREVLDALAKSVAPDMDATTAWLLNLVTHNSRFADEVDLRRPLAIKMANLINFGAGGAHTCARPDDLVFADKVPGPDRAHYAYFVEPALGRLRTLARREVIPVKRPDQPGDAELAALCARHGINPLKSA